MKTILGLCLKLGIQILFADTQLSQCISVREFQRFVYQCHLHESVRNSKSFDFYLKGSGKEFNHSNEYSFQILSQKLHESLPVPGSLDEVILQLNYLPGSERYKLKELIRPMSVKAGASPNQCPFLPNTGFQKVFEVVLIPSLENSRWITRSISFHPITYAIELIYLDTLLGKTKVSCKPIVPPILPGIRDLYISHLHIEKFADEGRFSPRESLSGALSPVKGEKKFLIESGVRKKSKSKAASRSEFRCLNCGIQETPEIRNGPLGAKTLCNRCGLRYRKETLSQNNSEHF